MKRENFYQRCIYDPWRRILPRYLKMEEDVVVLECGTGPGIFLSFLGEWFPRARLYGLDLDHLALHQAQQANKKAHLLVADAETLPFPAMKFDLIVSLHMIEHLPRPGGFFREVARVLRPGGILILATPNPTGIGARHQKDAWQGWRPEHISLHSPEEWGELLSKVGFAILQDGTTGLSGIPAFRKLPLGLLNWGPLFLFGFFPWQHGEAYICIGRKRN